MEEYHLKCQHCGSEFNAKRNDAKYCSDSCRTLASKRRIEIISPKKTELNIEFTNKELKQIKKQARLAKITPETLIKQKSLVTGLEIQVYKRKIIDLEEKINKLKAHLSTYTDEVEPSGMFIKANKMEINSLQIMLSKTFPDLTFDKAFVRAVLQFPDERKTRTNCQQELLRYKGLYETYKGSYEECLESYKKSIEKSS